MKTPKEMDKYEGVRFVRWDALWHAFYTTPKGENTWDRVSFEEARQIYLYLTEKRRNPMGEFRNWPGRG